MNKVKKFLIALSLILVVLCPLVFAGCSKNYTVNVVIKEGNGHAYLVRTESENAVGKNIVKKGDRFEIRVEPDEGQVISKIVINGEEVEVENYPHIDAVKKDSTIEIYFATAQYNVTFWCRKAGGTYEEYESLRTKVTYKTILDLNDAKYGGAKDIWFTLDAETNAEEHLYKAGDANSNKIKIRKDLKLYCDLTKDQLDEALAG